MTRGTHGRPITGVQQYIANPEEGVSISPRHLKIGLVALILGPTILLASWIVTDTIVHATSDEAFCGGCHTMTPMVTSYREDLHGGAGERGVRAKCSQCHVPHDNAINYIITKTRFGLHDAWAQLTYDLDAIDWQAKREHRETFVFDSACLECHADLQRASEASAKSFVAHRPYFLGTVESRCATCHERVGHKQLSTHLAVSGREGVSR